MSSDPWGLSDSGDVSDEDTFTATMMSTGNAGDDQARSACDEARQADILAHALGESDVQGLQPQQGEIDGGDAWGLSDDESEGPDGLVEMEGEDTWGVSSDDENDVDDDSHGPVDGCHAPAQVEVDSAKSCDPPLAAAITRSRSRSRSPPTRLDQLRPAQSACLRGGPLSVSECGPAPSSAGSMPTMGLSPPFLWRTCVDQDHPWTTLSSKMPGACWWADGVLNTLARWRRPMSYPCTPFYLDILCAGTAGEVYGLEALFVTICFVLFLSSNNNLQTERL